MSDTDPTLSEELGTPLAATEYTFDDLKETIQRQPQTVVDALVWTREYWKWFLPRYDTGDRAGYDPSIWYGEAIRRLHRAIADLETAQAMDSDAAALEPEWAGLVATAFEFYQEHYHHLRKGPEQDSKSRSYT